MDMRFLVFTFSFIFYFEVVLSVNVLMIQVLPVKSHFKFSQRLAEEIIRRGHNLTLVSSFHLRKQFHSNYTLIDLNKIYQNAGELRTPELVFTINCLTNYIIWIVHYSTPYSGFFWISLLEDGGHSYCHSFLIAEKLDVSFEDLMSKNLIRRYLTSFHVGSHFSKEVVKSPEIQRLIRSNDHYDLIMVEFFFTDLLFAFGSKFNAPIISLCSQSLLPFQNWIIGRESPSSYVPDEFSSLTETMSLASRISNAVINIFSSEEDLFYA